MSQLLYWGDNISGFHVGTFVHSKGHTLLRGIPAEVKDEFSTSVREFRSTLENADAVDPVKIHEWLESKGFTKDEANPLDLWIYSDPSDEAVAGDGDSLADMSLKDLKAMAKSLGVENYAQFSKDDLVAGIQAKQAELNPPAPATDENASGEQA